MKTVEYLIDYKDQWYIAHLAVTTFNGQDMTGPHRSTWIERDGSVICLAGEEYRSIDLREI